MSSLFLSCSWTGIAGATGLVLLTTLDDCVWLVPFVAAAPTRRIATLHALTFLLTLEALAIVLSIGTFVVVVAGTTRKGGQDVVVVVEKEELDPLLAIIAAILCWILAGYLIFKKWQKQRRKRQQRNSIDNNDTAQKTSVDYYGAIPLDDDSSPDTSSRGVLLLVEDNNSNNTSEPTTTAAPSSAHQPGIVMSLTFLGFLDEVAYFPSLILGHIFSAVELCVGSLLAGLIMVGIVTICLAPCRPFIEWLDTHVKMYGVVTIFAIVLTIQIVVEELY
jgi:hypothetical protein